MGSSPKQVVFVRSEDRKAVLKSLFLRESIFRKAVTAEDVKAGFRPRKAAGDV